MRHSMDVMELEQPWAVQTVKVIRPWIHAGGSRAWWLFVQGLFLLHSPDIRADDPNHEDSYHNQNKNDASIHNDLPSLFYFNGNYTKSLLFLYIIGINLLGVLLVLLFSTDSRADHTKCKNGHHDQNKNDTSIHNNVSSLFKLTINLCVFNDFFTCGIKKLFDRLVFVFFFLFASFFSANRRANHTKRENGYHD